MKNRASLNHIFRTVWNQALGAMVAVAEIGCGRGQSASSGLGGCGVGGPRRLATLPLCVAIAWGALAPGAFANPAGGIAIQGQATFDASQANRLLVTTQNAQGTNGSAINWQSFSIPAGNTTYFQQPSVNSTSINRVVTNTPSQLFGTLGSNGNLVLVNQSGITVGAGAVVDTAGFTASSLKMSDADALAGRLRFGDGAPATGEVSVFGNVVARSGDVVLLGSHVSTGKDALIQAPNGSTILVAGQQIELTGRGLEGITLQVQAPADTAVNLGTLKGDAVGIFAGTLKHSGVIQATTATLEGGKVVLKASGDAYVEGAGKIIATGLKGGAVDVLGNRVAVTDQATIDVSGTYAGGTVRAGGDYQGKNADVPNSQIAYFGSDASIKADAIDSGNGGKVIVWADDTTRAYGRISAQGGATSGDGGFVETSGHRQLAISGARVTTLAPRGETGKWLLDPGDITVTHGTQPVVTLIGTTSLPAITDYDINSALSSSNLIIATSGGTGGNGDITFDSSLQAIGINTASLRTLTLSADRDILFTNGLGTTFGLNGSTGGLNVILNATRSVDNKSGSTITLDGAAGVASVSRLTVPAGKTFDNHGVLNINGKADVNLATGAILANHSGGTVNAASSTGFSFVSGSFGPSADDGIIQNSGTINVTVGTAFEAAYNQIAGSFLNVKSVSLNLQNAQSIAGTIDLAPTGATSPGSLYVNEKHGAPAEFANTQILATNAGYGGTITVGGTVGGTPAANFSGVTADKIQLNVGASSAPGDVGITGDSRFLGVGVVSGYGAAIKINNATLGILGIDFSVPTSGISYLGNVGILAAGQLNISSTLTTPGSLTLVAGWDGVSLISPAVSPVKNVNLTNPAVVTSDGAMTVQAGGDISVGGGFVSNYSGFPALKLAATNTLALAAGSSVSGPNIILQGNSINVDPSATITSAGDVWLQPKSDPRAISLVATKSQTPNSLELTDAELNRVTAGTLHIGSGSLSLPLTVSAPISLANVGTLALESNTAEMLINASVSNTKTGGNITLHANTATGNITQSAGVLTAAELTVLSGGVVSLGGTNTNMVDTFAADVSSGSGGLTFKNGKALTVGTAGSVSGIVGAGNAINISTTLGGVTLGKPITSTSTVDISTPESIVDGNGASVNNISASAATLTAGTGGYAGSVNLDTRVSSLYVTNSAATTASTVEVRNTGSVLAATAYSSAATSQLTITNDKTINVGHIGGAAKTTLTTIGATSDITVAEACGGLCPATLLSNGNIELSAGGSILVTHDHIEAGYGGSVGSVTATAGADIKLDSQLYPTYIKAASGVSLTAGGGVTMDGDSGQIPYISSTSGNVEVRTGAAGFKNGTIAGYGGDITASAGRWFVYAPNPASVTKGGLTPTLYQYNTTSTGTLAPSGSGFIYVSPLYVDANFSGTLSSTYGNSPTATPGYTLRGLDSNDTSTASTIAANSIAYANWPVSSSTAAGTYSLQYSSISPALPYTLTGGTSQTYTVNPAAITIAAVGASPTGLISKTYDGTTVATLTPANYSLTGFVNGDSASVTKTSGTYSSKNVGTGLTVTTTLAPTDFSPVGATLLSNYTLPTSAAGNIGAITVAPLTVAANSTSKVFGSTLTFLGTEFTSSGLVAGETIGSVTLTSSGAVATASVAGGPYAIVPSAATGGTFALGNYAVSYANGALTVNPAGLVAVAASLSGSTTKVYDGTTTATLTPANYSLTGFVNGDSASVTKTSGTYSSQNVGTGLTVSTTLAPTDFSPVGQTRLSNYTLPTSATGNIGAITVAPLTVVANSTSKVFGSTLTFLGTEFTSSGLVAGETIGSVTLTSSGAVATASVAGGPYAIVPSAATGGTFALGNYAVSYANGALTVNPAGLVAGTASLSGSTTKVYDGTTTATLTPGNFVLSGFVNGDSAGVTKTTGTYASKNVGTGLTVTTTLAPTDFSPVGATLLSNYTLPTSAVGNIGSITVRPISTWSGAAGNNLWNDARNWDALPDGANVLSVSIGAGSGTVALDGGSVSLQNLSSAQTLAIGGGTLQVSGALSTSGFSQSGGAVSGAGSFTANGAFNQSGGGISMGSIAVTQSSGNMTINSLKAATVNLTGGSISETAAGGIEATTLTTQSNGGTVLTGTGNKIGTWTAFNTGSGALRLTNTGLINVTAINDGGDFNIDSFGGVVTKGQIKTSGAISITANSPLTIGPNGLSAGGNIVLTATNLTSAGNIVLNGPVETTAGSVALKAASNLEQNSSVTAPLGVSASAGGTLTLGPLATSGFQPVTYLVAARPVAPPPTPGALSTASDMVVAMMNSTSAIETPAEQQAQAAANVPVKDKDKEKDTTKETVVAEGGICRP